MRKRDLKDRERIKRLLQRIWWTLKQGYGGHKKEHEGQTQKYMKNKKTKDYGGHIHKDVRHTKEHGGQEQKYLEDTQMDMEDIFLWLFN